MTRPRSSFVALSLLALLGASCDGSNDAASADGPMPGAPDRIVLIVVDTLRRDHLGVYGGAIPTPNIDALAARGQALGDVRAAFHQTTMSMGSLFTGRTPSLETGDPERSIRWNGETWCGMARFAAEGAPPRCVPETLPTLGERIREAGYWTIGIPSNQFLFGAAGFSRGFDDWIEVGGPLGPSEVPASERPSLIELRSAERVLEAVDTALARRPTDHFFLYVHLMDVHDHHYRRLGYGEVVPALDATIGALIDRLESADLLEGTTIVLTADHGERLDETHVPRGRESHYGNPAFEEVLAIPLIVAPRAIDDGEAPRRTQDLHRWLQSLAGVEPGGPDDLAPDEQYLSERRFRTYVDGRWKTTIRRRDDRLFLYDLEADPGETRNVADAHPAIAARHRERIGELSDALAIDSLRSDRELSEEERATLEALGYIE